MLKAVIVATPKGAERLRGRAIWRNDEVGQHAAGVVGNKALTMIFPYAVTRAGHADKLHINQERPKGSFR